jgi:hypothetical protein
LEDLGVDEAIILEWVLRKNGMHKEFDGRVIFRFYKVRITT